jgi:putative aldouronate transport system permease protein
MLTGTDAAARRATRCAPTHSTMRPRKMRVARSKQLYAMMALPLAYFILLNYVPLAGNVPAFRRYRPGLGPFGTE